MSTPAAAEAAWWCARLADALGDVGRRVSALGEQVARDWPDAHGREWAERAGLLAAVLGREAVAAEELSGAYTRQETDAPVPLLPGVGGAGRRGGVRLGGTDAERVDPERGMRIAELPPQS